MRDARRKMWLRQGPGKFVISLEAVGDGEVWFVRHRSDNGALSARESGPYTRQEALADAERRNQRYT